MFVCLAIFIIFLLYINYLMSKNKRAQENLDRKFWDREREANFTRKKDISNLNYLIITEDKIPQNLTTDASRQLRALCGQNLLNLSSMSNTDLKLQYGAANLDELSACDDRFSAFATNSAVYAQELTDAGYVDEARQLLEYAIACQVDNSSVYTQLAALYQSAGNRAGISGLFAAAQNLAPLPQKLILERLKPFAP